LFAADRASQALGMRISGVRPGWARVTMQVRPDMVNGHGVCHGGLVFALGDSAFAFACNSYNDSTVAAAATIDFLAAAREGDELTAESSELWRTRRNGLYEIVVTNQRGERIALFRGRSYRIDGQVVSGVTSPPDQR
jgi:acyl-CoA thioesterase